MNLKKGLIFTWNFKGQYYQVLKFYLFALLNGASGFLFFFQLVSRALLFNIKTYENLNQLEEFIFLMCGKGK